jgi:predicted MFS family arabinose efflux permease
MNEQSRPAGRQKIDQAIDWRLLAPVLAHVVVTHVVVLVVRVTISYRTIELGLSEVWLGIISASFAILPIFTALRIGRYIDRGHDAHAAWIGSALTLVSAVALWAWPGSTIHLLAFTILLGSGHMFLMAAQQMLCVRSASERGREIAFGHYMVAVSIGQGLGPLLVGWIGGGVTVPATPPLFTAGVITAVLCMGVALTVRPAARQIKTADGPTVPLADLLRRPGMAPVLAASVVTVTASDLLVIYLPLVGAERNIEASHIGLLLTVRAIAALVARLFYARLIQAVGRLPLTLVSTLVGAAAFALMAVPSLPVMYAASVAIGIGLGIAATLTISGIVLVAPPEARATAMTMRITGNRLGLVLMPLVAGLIAAATGGAGILLLLAGSLTACALGMRASRAPS